MKRIVAMLVLMCGVALCTGQSGCEGRNDSDKKQEDQQEKLLLEATAQTGMPAIKNFRERKLLKEILELRDQDGLVTYTYLENQISKIEPGVTARGGKLTYLGESIGYGIPYATQYTNPQKVVYPYSNSGSATQVIAQADPNSLFSPASAEGTWVLLKDPNGDKVLPCYIEPRILVFPFKIPLDK